MSDRHKLTHPTLSRPSMPSSRRSRTFRSGLGKQWHAFQAGQKKTIQSELAGLQRSNDRPDFSKGVARYMYKRSVMGRKFEADQAHRLISADATVNETRGILSKGRGNVTSDVDQSGGESTWRTAAGRAMRDELDDRVKTSVKHQNPGLTSAWAAMAVRAGNCGEHGTVATHLDAHRLQSENRTGESVYRASSTATDHGWSERRNRDGQWRQSDILMDAWGEGSAVERSDSNFGQQIKNRYHFHTGQMPTHDFRDLVSKTPDSAKQMARQKFQNLQSRDYRFKHNWAPTSVFSDEFRHNATTALSELGTVDKLRQLGRDTLTQSFTNEQRVQMKRNAPGRRDMLQDIHKVGVLRTLGASLRTAKSEVE